MAQAHDSYKITLEGPFDVSWADYIGDQIVHIETGEGKPQTTTLFGYAVDLAAFLGTLHTFIDLGYPVISFEYHRAAADAARQGNAAGRGRQPK